MGIFGGGRDGPSARERALIRRHLETLEERREELLRDVGGLALEMHRRNRFNADLLREKADEVGYVNAEIELVQAALDRDLTIDELKALGAQARAEGRLARS